MARSTPTKLEVSSRQPAGSRSARRLRRDGFVPGILYGGDGENLPFQVDARTLRLALAGTGAVLDLSIDGSASTPVVLKEAVRDVVRGDTLHVDLVRVRLDRPIQVAVVLELTGAEEAPGVTEGGVLEQITRELNVEALPTAIPESITFDVSQMVIGDTLTLSALTAPDGARLLDDPEETVIATLNPPRLQIEEEEGIETETELVGEDGASAEAESGEGDSAEGAGSEDAAE
ncbi:MAG: 50S ribosomal protein L25 [Solirubrobacteraceae bacterium]